MLRSPYEWNAFAGQLMQGLTDFCHSGRELGEKVAHSQKALQFCDRCGCSHSCHCLNLVRHWLVSIYSIGLTKECDLLLAVLYFGNV